MEQDGSVLTPPAWTLPFAMSPVSKFCITNTYIFQNPGYGIPLNRCLPHQGYIYPYQSKLLRRQ